MAESAPRRFVRYMYDHGMRTGGHSWREFNPALWQTLCLAIESRMKFALGDFAKIYADCAGEYWFGKDHDGKGMGARLYTTACCSGNLSACLSFEHWRGRKPYLWAGRRLYVGSDKNQRPCGFPWDGYERVLVSTIRPDVLIATAGLSIKRIWKIPHATFAEIERLRRRVSKACGLTLRGWERATRLLATRPLDGKPIPVHAKGLADTEKLAALMRPKAKLRFVAAPEQKEKP